MKKRGIISLLVCGIIFVISIILLIFQIDIATTYYAEYLDGGLDIFLRAFYRILWRAIAMGVVVIGEAVIGVLTLLTVISKK